MHEFTREYLDAHWRANKNTGQARCYVQEDCTMSTTLDQQICMYDA
jgi:hypothetical protein